MDILAGLAGFVIGAFGAWEIAQGFAAAEMKSLWSSSEEKLRYWQAEAKRAKASADRAEELVAAWREGCQQGREDALTLVRSLTLHPQAESSRSRGVR